MIAKRSMIFAPVLVLAVLAVTFVAYSVGASQQVTAEDVVTRMRETAKNTQTMQGTIDLSVTLNKQGIETLVDGIVPGGMSDTGKAGPMGGKDWLAKAPDLASATLKVLKKNPDKMKVEVVNSTLPKAAGKVAVYDGDKFYAYDPDNKTVYTGTPDKMSDGKMGDMMGMMQGADFDKEVDKVLNASDIKMAGTEKVAGVDTYKLDVTPKPDAADLLGLPQAFKMQAGVLIKDVKATVWVDQSRWVPVKVVVNHPNIGELTYTATGVELNQPVQDTEFVLQVPAGTKTVDLDAMQKNVEPQSMTITEAKAGASKDGWSLLEPSYLPDGATLIEVRALRGIPVPHFILTYSSPSSDLTIAQAKGAMEPMLGDSFSGRNDSAAATQKVTVRGVEAIAFAPEGAGWTSLMWKEKGSDVMVAIRGKLSVEEAVKIAEGLK